MQVDIDSKSGFCFGVVKAVQKAEVILDKESQLYCLGEIVHNQAEVDRLKKMGMISINKETYKTLKNCKVLIRAHGEPPETYEYAKENNIELIDATCPIVLKLQERVKRKYDSVKEEEGSVVIYGKEDHAEMLGISGNIENNAIIVKDENDLDKIDFSKPVRMFSQTTMSRSGYMEMSDKVKQKMTEAAANDVVDFESTNSICGHVSIREPSLIEFSQTHDVILFVSGSNSSNGKMLHKICKSYNPNSYFIGTFDDVQLEWFKDARSVGVCGATSTPQWLMQEVADKVKEL